MIILNKDLELPLYWNISTFEVWAVIVRTNTIIS